MLKEDSILRFLNVFRKAFLKQQPWMKLKNFLKTKERCDISNSVSRLYIFAGQKLKHHVNDLK